MTEPKFKVGDLVMIRGSDVDIDKAEVTALRLINPGTLIDFCCGDTAEYTGVPIYVYELDVTQSMFPENVVFPYQQPGDDFESLMKFCTDPVNNHIPIPEPA